MESPDKPPVPEDFGLTADDVRRMRFEDAEKKHLSTATRYKWPIRFALAGTAMTVRWLTDRDDRWPWVDESLVILLWVVALGATVFVFLRSRAPIWSKSAYDLQRDKYQVYRSALKRWESDRNI